MRTLLKTILVLTALAAFATSAHARTIYWDGTENPDEWEVINHLGGDPSIQAYWYHSSETPYNYTLWSVFFNGLGGNYCYYGCAPNRKEGDTSLISNTVPVPEAEGVSLAFEAFLNSNQPENITDATLSFGIQPSGGTSSVLSTNLIPQPALEYEATDSDISRSYPLTDELLDGAPTFQFWWRIKYPSVPGNDGRYIPYVSSVCLLDDCASQQELRRHSGQVDGLFDTDTLFNPYDRIEAISCLPAREVSGYLRSIKGLLYHLDGGRFRGPGSYTIYRSDAAAGQAPENDSAVWRGPEFTTPGELVETGQEFICHEIALEALEPDENVCVGINVSLGYDDWALIAYENVGAGNSHSYVRKYRRSPDNQETWIWMDDKEFLFSATMDVDCEDPWPTTTTTTTTTGGSSTTTSTTVSTSTTTTSTMPMDDDDSTGDDSMDDDLTDDDTATEDDAATSDDDDDDNDDGGGICGS
ncbi:hypothetical protein KDL45_09065 [bacterium]|nr:hypothetical protein [bacterium]